MENQAINEGLLRSLDEGLLSTFVKGYFNPLVEGFFNPLMKVFFLLNRIFLMKDLLLGGSAPELHKYFCAVLLDRIFFDEGTYFRWPFPSIMLVLRDLILGGPAPELQ